MRCADQVEADEGEFEAVQVSEGGGLVEGLSLACHAPVAGQAEQAAGVRRVTMGQAMARLAGALRARDGLDSCHTVDAFVVATSVRLGGGIIATGDPSDLSALARDPPNVRIEAI